MRLGVGAHKSVWKSLKIELKPLSPGAGLFRLIPSVAIPIGGLQGIVSRETGVSRPIIPLTKPLLPAEAGAPALAASLWADSAPSWAVSPRIIQIPLSGGDRKAQAKGIRQAHGLHASYFRESVLIREAAEAKLRDADRLECDAWNAIMWAGGPAMPSPGEAQANPTIAKALNAGYDLVEAKCNRCRRISLVSLRAIKRPADTPIWKLEPVLYCEPCSDVRGRRQRAHILRLTFARPDGGTTEKAQR
ncbi:hypothetical protein ABIA95_003082 [Bradyrhizobium sp. LA8.1]|uniref:hypothetical protein n=1 Tax=unclassified Bradyrhizobium TaxID=2631580 RepID=UPI003398A959